MNPAKFNVGVGVREDELDFDEVGAAVGGPKVIIAVGHADGCKDIGYFLLCVASLCVRPSPYDDV